MWTVDTTSSSFNSYFGTLTNNKPSFSYTFIINKSAMFYVPTPTYIFIEIIDTISQAHATKTFSIPTTLPSVSKLTDVSKKVIAWNNLATT